MPDGHIHIVTPWAPYGAKNQQPDIVTNMKYRAEQETYEPSNCSYIWVLTETLCLHLWAKDGHEISDVAKPETRSRGQIQGQTWQDINFPPSRVACVVFILARPAMCEAQMSRQEETTTLSNSQQRLIKLKEQMFLWMSHTHIKEWNGMEYDHCIVKCFYAWFSEPSLVHPWYNHTRNLNLGMGEAVITPRWVRLSAWQWNPTSEALKLTELWQHHSGLCSKTKSSVRLMYRRNVPTNPSSLDTRTHWIKLASFLKKNLYLFPKF